MEERVDGLSCRCPLLNIIDDEHVDGEIEVDEVVDHITSCSICKLYLKQSCRHVKHSFLRIQLLASHSDGIDEMGLSTTRWSVDVERIER